MSTGTVVFMVATLAGAVASYNHHAFLSIVLFLLFLGTAFGTGKLG